MTQNVLAMYRRRGELGWRSWYSNKLWAGLRGQSLSPSRANNFFFSTLSRPALGSTQPPIQWVLGALSQGVKLTTHLQLVQRSRKCDPYIHSPIHLHGIVLNSLIKHRDKFIFLYFTGREEASGKKFKRKDCGKTDETGDSLTFHPKQCKEVEGRGGRSTSVGYLTLERCSPFNSYSLLGRRTFKYLNAVNATFHLKCNKLGKTVVLFF
jgi:hypothetical protein